jgi:peptidoglycan-N-acetylglucosamine deacetylase
MDRIMRALTVCLLLMMLATNAAAHDLRSPWSLAVTIDDLPMTGPGSSCDPRQIESVNTALLGALSELHIRATAFFVPGSQCQGEGETAVDALAERWRSRGHDVGNHTYSHPDFNHQTTPDYLADAERAHLFLEPILACSGQTSRWFRPPLLHAGADSERKTGLLNWLVERDYRMGVVTIDNQEWVFANAYARAEANGDHALMSRIVTAYIAHIEECVRYYRALSHQLFGRDIPQVLLLHANQLNAAHLSSLLTTLEQTGARFVSLEDAVSDSAYSSPDEYVGPRGLSWLQRWALSRGFAPTPEPREPEWIATIAQ